MTINKIKKYAIIVAGGSGTRMQGDVPKQFIVLNGKPVIQYSMEAFHAFDPSIGIIIVIHPDFRNLWGNLCADFKISIPHVVALGGKTRFESVKNGLNVINEEGLVAIHDAARPLINEEFLNHLFNEAGIYGSAVPGITLTDTIRIIEGDTSRQLDRTLLRAIQTPQIFKVSELKRAYTQTYHSLFTDDASVMQAAGFPIHVAEGMPENIKITIKQDIALAEVLLKV